MTSSVRLLLCAVALLSLSGCATVRTLDAAKPGAPVVYAGTRLDWYAINGGCCPLDRFGAEAPRYAGLDLPASALLDTLLRQPQGSGRRSPGPARPRIAQDYAALGVPADAEPAAIKRAYRRLMARHHPDRAGDDPTATARAQAINDAYRRIREARGF